MKRILCPVDFSPTALNGLHYAFQTAKRLGSELFVMYASHVPMAVEDGMVVPVDFKEEEKEIKAKMERICQKMQPDDISEKVTTHVCVKVGMAEDTIVQLSADESIELIILGTKGAKGWEKLFGTIAAGVAEKAPCPVMIVPEGYTFQEPKHMVYATDLEGNEDVLILYLGDFAQSFGAHISFVNIQKKNHEDPEKLIAKGVKLLEKTDYPNTSFHVFEKEDVVEGINEFAEKRKADVVVMAIREKNFLQRTFLKSHTLEEAYQVSRPFIAMHKQ